MNEMRSLDDFKEIVHKRYSSYIEKFKHHNIELTYKIEKISYIVKGRVTVVAEIKLKPYKEYREKEKYWKTFSTKLFAYKGTKNNYRCITAYKTDCFLRMFLNSNLKKASKLSPEKTCKENLGNYLFRVLCFSRFHKFPISYRGKDLSILYFILVLLLIGILGTTQKDLFYEWFA